jgi:hypothetical protein
MQSTSDTWRSLRKSKSLRDKSRKSLARPQIKVEALVNPNSQSDRLLVVANP